MVAIWKPISGNSFVPRELASTGGESICKFPSRNSAQICPPKDNRRKLRTKSPGPQDGSRFKDRRRSPCRDHLLGPRKVAALLQRNPRSGDRLGDISAGSRFLQNRPGTFGW